MKTGEPYPEAYRPTTEIVKESQGLPRAFVVVPRFEAQNLQTHAPLVELVRNVAEGLGATPAQVALAWVLAQGEAIVPIPGTKHGARLLENLGAAGVTLSSEDIRTINAALDAIPVAGDRYPAAFAKRVAP